jgi:glycosyltransferase involved in cell wall biosynthesis
MLFNTDFDAMGRTPLEAMSYGIPTVASVTQCGLPEVIDTDEVGFLIRNHDVPRLAERVIELLRDEQAAKALGARGRQRVAEVGCPRQHALRILNALGVETEAADAAGMEAR